ncbi:aldose 1-epimerase family protein [Paenibacillus filicis]|uniref:Aldose 1-epimerase family protein n=1 Tax=Paenibacillus gyeongsangnamensis TaxID=3388067 RepID=A0ABT4Q4C9_9BACL|nr:aldose 1-epimerase family protein [Paenibacillus filicis]MCZ8511737.1 aldose 1-epimerase family protein [Paenibacillus filicis]
MVSIYGINRKQALLERVGDIRQVAGFQRMELLDGKGKGNEIIQVRNGSGLEFQISVSRAFDIGFCEFYGIPISWMSHTGPVSPYFYEKDGTEWNRSFEGGLLATCGLTYFGKPSVDKGQQLGQHGRISSSPAELLQAEDRWIGDNYQLLFRGKVRESKALEECVTLERTISTCLGENRLKIVDQITNDTFQTVEHMLMYHFNFGFPLVSNSCRIQIPNSNKRWIIGEGPTADSDRYGEPTFDAKPCVILHEEVESIEGHVKVGIHNEILHNGVKKRLLVELNYEKAACPYLTQWKHQRKGVYVLGIEPGNVTTEGRGIHRERGTLPFLQPGETKEYQLTLDFQLKEC